MVIPPSYRRACQFLRENGECVAPRLYLDDGRTLPRKQQEIAIVQGKYLTRRECGAASVREAEKCYKEIASEIGLI